MSEVIHIGKVTVPLVDYAVGAAAILGIRDSGKTVTAKGIAEQLMDNDIQPIIFDAVGKWRYLKSPGPKNGKGYKVVVAGGRNPDLPLTPHSVPEIVRAALKERIPLVIDLFEKTLSKADWRRIVQTAIRIIHYENEGGAVHVFLEEAAEFVPQRVMDGEVYAEVEKLVRMGGNASVGITLINQRSQEVNKAVLDQCTTLILGCQVGSKAIEAVGKWMDRLDAETANEVTTSLPTLTAGQDWVWTRQNPDRPHRVQIPMCRSLHPDRRTPETVIKSCTPTDTAEFVAKMQGAIPKIIEDAKANDPAQLKREIHELRKQLKGQVPMTKEVTKEVSVFKPEHLKVFNEAVRLFEGLAAQDEKRNERLKLLCHDFTAIRRDIGTLQKPVFTSPRLAISKLPMVSVSQRQNPKSFESSANGSLGRCERAILTVLAEHPQGCNSVRLGIRSVYSVTSGGFNNSLGKLRSLGYITRGNPVMVTPQGIEALGNPEPLPEGAALQSAWGSKLGRCERMILEALCKEYPSAFSSEQLGDVTGYSHNSGGFNNSLGKLRTLELINRGQPIKASDELFE